MKTLKIIFNILIVLVVMVALFVGFCCLCKWLNWLPEFTDWVKINIYDNLGLTFFGKI